MKKTAVLWLQVGDKKKSIKKIFLSAAVLAMIAAGCQNEALVEQDAVQKDGQLITLKVGKALNSRTTLGNDNATNWSEGDKIYVSGNNGKVTGVLTLIKGKDTPNGTFEGYIFGGTELNHVVFPVPQGGRIDMSNRVVGKLDAPMIGTIGKGGNTVSLNNVGTIVAFKADQVYGVKAYANGQNMSSGSYTFDAKTGTLTYIPSEDINDLTPTYIPEGSELAYVPVATTLEADDGTSKEVLGNLQVNVVENGTVISSATIKEVVPGQIFGDDEEEQEGLGGLDINEIDEISELEAAVENGGTYRLTESLEITSTLNVACDALNLILDEGVVLSGNTDIFTIEQSNVKLMISGGTLSVAGDTHCALYLNRDASDAVVALEHLTIVENEEAENDTFASILKNGIADNLTLTVNDCKLSWIYVSDDFDADTKNKVVVTNSVLETVAGNCLEILNTDLTVNNTTLINNMEEQQAYEPGKNTGNDFATVTGYCIAAYNKGTDKAVGSIWLDNDGDGKNNVYECGATEGKIVFYQGYTNEISGIDKENVNSSLEKLNN